MARKTVRRDLTALEEFHPGFTGFPGAENHTTALNRALREIIARQRRLQDCPFYALREVAAFFHVNYRTVARVYETLEADGLLKLVRGSCTLMRGKRLAPAHPVLGVVGIPVLLPSFIFGSAGRAFYALLEKELRQRHFVADFIFYRNDEEDHPDLAQRFLEHELDILLWMAPKAQAASTIMTMMDAGVSVVIVNDGKGVFARQQYRLDLERAYKQTLADWQAEGIRHIEVWAPARGIDSHILRTLRRVLERGAISHSVHELPDADVPSRIQAQDNQPEVGVILVSHQWYDGLCAQFPERMERLFRTRRVLLPQGPLYHPGFAGRDLYADTIQLDPQPMVSRIVADIASGGVDSADTLTTFHTRYHPRTNLGLVQRDI
jgi:hypothetical protein